MQIIKKKYLKLTPVNFIFNLKSMAQIKISLEIEGRSESIDIESEETVFTLTLLISNLFNLENFYLEMNSRRLEDEEPVKNLDRIVYVRFYKKEEMKKMNFDFLKNNPMIQKQLDANPDLKGLITEETLQSEMAKMMEDPNYFKTQAKYADMAMAKLENIPGGLSMVNSYLDNIKDPFQLKSTVKVRSGEINKNVTSEPIIKKNENLIGKYLYQLRTLQQFGFNGIKFNLDILISVEGDLEKSLELLNK